MQYQTINYFQTDWEYMRLSYIKQFIKKIVGQHAVRASSFQPFVSFKLSVQFLLLFGRPRSNMNSVTSVAVKL